VSVPGDLWIPADKSELTIPLKAAAGAGASASLVCWKARRPSATPRSNAPRWRRRRSSYRTRSGRKRAADVRRRHDDEAVLQGPARRSGHGPKSRPRFDHPAEILIERLDRFSGEITLQMAAMQSYQHQGITGGEVIVPPGVEKTLYPCFMPEWLESTRTSRMGIIAVARLPIPKARRGIS